MERRMPGLVRQLTSPPEHSALAASYARFYDHQQAARRAVSVLPAAGHPGSCSGIPVRTFLRMRVQTQQLQLAASVFASASEGITITDDRGTILNVNAAFTRLTGYDRADVLGKNPRVLQFRPPKARVLSADVAALTRDGTGRARSGTAARWRGVSGMAVHHRPHHAAGGLSGRTHYVATFSDISQRKKDEAEIYQLAFYDPLTALPNRRLLIDRLRQILNSRSHGAGQAALLFIDVDNSRYSTTPKATKSATCCWSEIGAACSAARARGTRWPGWAAMSLWCCCRVCVPKPSQSKPQPRSNRRPKKFANCWQHPIDCVI
jgi:PAS domain S-box-containing protein